MEAILGVKYNKLVDLITDHDVAKVKKRDLRSPVVLLNMQA